VTCGFVDSRRVGQDRRSWCFDCRPDVITLAVRWDRAIGSTKVIPVEVVTDKAAVYPKVPDEVAPACGVQHRSRGGDQGG
jgi:hypothetical protein